MMKNAAAPLFATLDGPVVYLEAGGAVLIARPCRTERGLVCGVPRDAVVVDVARRAGIVSLAVLLSPPDEPEQVWREQLCRATVVDDTTIMLEALSRPLEQRAARGAVPAT